MKMLEEEIELRKWAIDNPADCQPCEAKKDFYNDIKILIRAVRKDCMKKVEEEFRIIETYHAEDKYELLKSNIFAAIRRSKRKPPAVAQRQSGRLITE